MDELVPISWVRQPENQDTLGIDSMYVSESELPSTNPALQGNKQPPAVAVYLLQFYPVTQACVQPCVTTTTNDQFTTSAIPQVSFQQPTSSGPCLVPQSSQVCSMPQNQNEIKQPNQCLVIQDSIVASSKVPMVEKWRDDGKNKEHHGSVFTTSLQECSVQPTNQVTAGTLSVCVVDDSNSVFATKTLQTIDHNVRTQPGEKPYSCNVCGKVFARAHNLKAHSQTHSEGLPFSCKICRKSYSQEAYYRIHSEILSGGRPYTCEVCSKVFCNSRSFNFHVRSHSRRKCMV